MKEKSSSNTKLNVVFFHVISWMLFIHFIFDFEGLFHSFKHYFIYKDNDILDEAFLLIPVIIGLFYWNLSFLIPRLLIRRSWLHYSISVLASYILSIVLCSFLYDLIDGTFRLGIPKQDFIDDNILFIFQALVASAALGVGKIARDNLSQKREAEQKQKEAELKYLANQFNPHFLYNTLNGIYSKAIEENAPETTEAILRLSEIMRYPINQGLRRQVALTTEVAFIQNYIALQKIRLGEDYPIQFSAEGNFEGIKILPLSLIVLVENAFKYGVSQKNKTPIFFYLNSDESQIIFKTENHIKNNTIEDSHKIGLQNLEKRLQLNYDDNFELITERKEGNYHATLKLIIK